MTSEALRPVENADTSGPVVVATASTLQEADVLRAAIWSAGVEAMIANEYSSNTLSHLNIAVNPRGIQVIVAPQDAEAARDALAASCTKPEIATVHEEIDGGSATQDEPLPDELARKAYWSAFLAWLLPPIAFITLYWFIRAITAARARRPVHQRLYRWHMAVALLLGIGLAGVITLMAVWGSVAALIELIPTAS